MKLLLKISFVGTAYNGFQCQKNGVAVQNVLTDAAGKVFGEKCLVTGSSRTDAGVHALGFCVTVETPDNPDAVLRIPTEKVHRAFRTVLPEDISVVGAAVVSDDFHPRYSAKGKKYIYRIWDRPTDNPFEINRSARCFYRITDEKLETLKKAASYFVGRHDFASFMASGSKITDTVREVFISDVYREDGGAVVFAVAADGFLYNMVRIMAGTLLDTLQGKISPDDIPKIISSRDRRTAGPTAPPYGLYLKEVYYDEKINWLAE